MTKLQGTLFDDLPIYLGHVSKHPVYRVWCGIIARCYNPAKHGFHNYGGRGIYVCDEWRASSRAFVSWAIANGWQRGLQLDRENNDGPYSPGNCRFVAPVVNQNNRRNNRRLGDGLTVAQASRRAGVSAGTVHARVSRGMSPDAALVLPIGRRGPLPKLVLPDGVALSDAIRCCGLRGSTVRNRLRRGWSFSEALSIPKGGKRPLPDGFKSVGDAAARVVAATVAKIAQGESEAATLGDQAQRSAARRKPKAKGNGHA